MKRARPSNLKSLFIITSLALILAACTTGGPKTEKGPRGTIAYFVEVDASEKGARIDVDNEHIGSAPTVWKVFGDKDGTFHDFGNFDHKVTAYPISGGLQPQTKAFKTGRFLSGEDRIPKKIYFDFSQPPAPSDAK
jgi:hypothetical protein